MLEKHGVSFAPGSSDPPWYDRFPFLKPPPRIEVLTINSGANLESILPILQNLGTIRRICIYDLSIRDIELLSQVKSIRSVEAQWGLSANQVRPLLSLPLEDFSVTGADVNIPESALELLLTIPTIKSIGMAHGESGVSKKLRVKYPKVSYYTTDFPP
jgi:hypothetical protein